MGIIELLITAVALSMDAFAVAICKGLATGKIKSKHMIICGLWFGGFQAAMPLIGYFLAGAFAEYIMSFDHWVAFALLGFIGGKMLLEAFGKEECECCDGASDKAFGVKTMLTMAIATSIDALAVGITFALLPDVDIAFAVSSIGVITFLLSAVGVKIGSIFGAKYKFVAELIGGFTLVGMGIKILLEHLFFA